MRVCHVAKQARGLVNIHVERDAMALDYGSGGLGSSPGQGRCVVFSVKTLYPHSASLHPGVGIGTGQLFGQPDGMLG